MDEPSTVEYSLVLCNNRVQAAVSSTIHVIIDILASTYEAHETAGVSAGGRYLDRHGGALR